VVTLDEDLDPKTLQVDDGGEDNDGRDEVHNVRQTFPPKHFMECTSRIAPNEDEIEQRKDSTLEFGSTSNVDSGRREGFPNDGLANVGSDKGVGASAKAVPFLEELVEKGDEEGCDDELDDEEEADAGAEVFGLAVETGEDVDGCLVQGDDEREDE
jgi:hypothetical protein